MVSSAPTSTIVSPTAARLYPSFQRTLAAQNKSERTMETYSDAVRLFDRFLKAQGMPSHVTGITREYEVISRLWEPHPLSRVLSIDPPYC